MLTKKHRDYVENEENFRAFDELCVARGYTGNISRSVETGSQAMLEAAAADEVEVATTVAADTRLGRCVQLVPDFAGFQAVDDSSSSPAVEERSEGTKRKRALGEQKFWDGRVYEGEEHDSEATRAKRHARETKKWALRARRAQRRSLRKHDEVGGWCQRRAWSLVYYQLPCNAGGDVLQLWCGPPALAVQRR